ncbi:MAG: hypothetical protein KGI58_00945 [Patescibacteria group bacterium]|nr:hypothetical protein [Patescibacteria group bacterium]
MKKLLAFILIGSILPMVSVAQSGAGCNCNLPDVRINIHGILWLNDHVFTGSKDDLLSLYDTTLIKEPNSPDSLSLIAIEVNPRGAYFIKPNGTLEKDSHGDCIIKGIVRVHTFHRIKKRRKRGEWKITPHTTRKENIRFPIIKKKNEQESIVKII